MKSFVASIMVLAFVGSVCAQGSSGGNLLGNLLGGLGMGQPQPQRPGLFDSLLGQQPQSQGLGDLTQLTQGLTNALSQTLNPSMRQSPSMNYPSMNYPSQNFPGMNQQNGLGQMLSQLPRRTLEMMQQALNAVSRMLPLSPNQMQSPYGQQLPPNQVQGLDNLLRSLTQQLEQGRTPAVNQLTNELSRTISSLTQGQQPYPQLTQLPESLPPHLRQNQGPHPPQPHHPHPPSPGPEGPL